MIIPIIKSYKASNKLNVEKTMMPIHAKKNCVTNFVNFKK